MIILEGIDGSGKTTLGKIIAQHFRVPFQPGEGPPRPGEDINDRIRSYMRREGLVVFDRHPVVSQSIYNMMGSNPQKVDSELYEMFHKNPRNIFIYCDPLEKGLGNATSDHPTADTPEFIAELESKYLLLLQAYRAWGVNHAKIVYRIGDHTGDVIAMIEALLDNRRRHFKG